MSTGSSFYWAMRLLPKERREAMLALYALARRLDDIADGPGTPAEKLAALDAWRPPPKPRLDADEIAHLLDGIRRDAAGGLVAPSLDALRLYCRQVAGSIGVMTVRALGRPEMQGYALALGEALQLVNILRDRAEDARRRRLYLPREILERRDISTTDPMAAMAHPALATACADLAALAREAFTRADQALGKDRHGLGAARAMGAIYRRLLDRLEQRGWQVLEPRLELGGLEKLALTLFYFLVTPR